MCHRFPFFSNIIFLLSKMLRFPSAASSFRH
ncbi:hypothetical protein GLYMA_18G121650v4 [Glycine max]|nr:hypothetical protein GLYMA_18G121650v4 [Glycine max]KAH1154228.1 hypothetical protein GYH30_049749 [Glycine max]